MQEPVAIVVPLRLVAARDGLPGRSGLTRFTPPLHLLKHPRLHLKALRFCPAVELQLRERIVDRAEWLVGRKGVFDARLHGGCYLALFHDVEALRCLRLQQWR